MSFGDDVRRFAQKSSRSIERIVRETELELYRSVIYDTPVDEGRLRANWFLSQGAESTEATDDVPAPLQGTELGVLRGDPNVINNGVIKAVTTDSH